MRNSKGQFVKGNIPSHAAHASFICKGCKKDTPCHPYELKWREYCIVECRKKYNTIIVKCAQCSKEKQIFANALKKNKNFFCNHKCYSAFKVGKAHPAILGDKHPMKKPENRAKVTGIRHGRWTGELPGNTAVHRWVTYHFGKANKCINNPSHKGPYDWSNISYQYLRDIEDWEQLCRRCHYKKDKEYREKTNTDTTRFVFDNKGKRI